MTLRTVDLDNPATLNHRWAGIAAVYAARGWGDDVYADGPIRHYHDGGGNWARMVLLPGGRAVLFGHDHEYSETYWAEAAEYFQEEETDLLADAPAWWGEAVAAHRGDDEWIGFIYGWERDAWSRADYDAADGFRSVGLPAASDAQALETARTMIEAQPAAEALRAALAAGPEVTHDQLAAVLPPEADAVAAAEAARKFRL